MFPNALSGLWLVLLPLISLLPVAAVIVGCKKNKKKKEDRLLKTCIDVRHDKWHEQWCEENAGPDGSSNPGNRPSFEEYFRDRVKSEKEHKEREIKDKEEKEKNLKVRAARAEEIKKGAVRAANDGETVMGARDDFREVELIAADKPQSEKSAPGMDATGVTQGDQTGTQADGVADGKKSGKDSKKSQKSGK